MITRDEWLERYDQIKTRKQAQTALNSFDRFLFNYGLDEQTVIADLVKQDPDKRYLFLQKYVNYSISKNVSASGIKNYFTFIRNYLRFQGLKTDPDEIKFLIKFPKPLKEIREPMTKEILTMLLNTCNKSYRAFFLMLISTGARMSEVLSLTPEDIDFDKDPIVLHFSPLITKTSTGREGYLTKQAKDHIRIYETNNPFKKNKLIFPFTQDDAETYFNRLRKKCKLLKKYSNDKNYHVNIQSLRSFFITEASLKHNEAYAHGMIGRGAYLQQYLRIPQTTRVKKYKALEPFLTIPLN